MQQDSEFYIGWQATAPPSFARVIRRSCIALAVVVPVLVIWMVYFQNGFSNGVFEYQKTTTLEGIYTEKPFPFLQFECGKDAFGQPVFQKVLLVGTGKFGFHPEDPQIKDGSLVQMTGNLIYNDGKTAFQVEQMKSRTIGGKQPPAPENPLPKNNFQVTLRGEITDPKCLLGVMNPGQGKPHRECAVRCIAGGIPPVLKVANSKGETEYYLLTDADGNSLSERILDFVGDGVQICGRLEQMDDWWVLYADPTTLQRVNKGALHPGPMCH